MDKFPRVPAGRRSIGPWIAVVAFLLAASAALAHRNPSDCQINQVPLGISNIPSTTVTEGAVITYTVNFTLPPPAPNGVCQITAVDSDLTLPNGTVIPILRNATIDPGDNFFCPSADPRCVTAGPYTYTVAEAHVTGPRSGCPPGSPLAPAPRRVTAFATSVGDAHNFGTDPAFDHLDNNQGCVLAINEVRTPRLRITKQCVDGNCEDGLIAFNGTVTNTGDENLVSVTVVDDHAGLLLGPTTLAVGESKTFSGSYIATGTPSTNVVTATGTGAETGVSTSATASAICTLSQRPCIEVTKVCQDATVPGGPITFNGTVTNCGDVSLRITSISDDKAGAVTGCSAGTVLAPGASCTYSGSYTPTECPSTNTVTVNAVVTGAAAERCGAAEVSDSSGPQTCTAPVNPGIRVTKDCQNGTNPDSPLITFTGTVTNTGNVPLDDVTVTDDKAGLVLGPITLAVGESRTFAGSYVPTQCVSTNTVTAVGIARFPDSCGGGPVSHTATDICEVPQNPGIVVTKVCRDAATPGGAITFNGTITNTGNITLLITSLVDDKAGPLTPSATTLAPGASATYSGSYTPTECPSTNTVTVNAVTTGAGAALCGPTPVSDSSDPQTCTAPGNPRILVTKRCQNGTNPDSPLITFNGTVTNTGDVPLEGVTVTDDKAGLVLGPVTLAVGESRTFSGSYVPTQCISTNTVTAVGLANIPVGCGGGPVSDTATDTCEVPQRPGIVVTKICHNPTTSGGAITFNGTITNTGNITLLITSLVDDKAGPLTPSATTLAPGASATYSGSYTPTECPSTDTVTVNAVTTGAGAALCGPTTVSDSSDPQTCTAPGNPSLRVTKDCQNGTDPDNPQICFTGTVTNTGDVPLADVTVTDDKAGLVLGPITTLAPGESRTFSGCYVPTHCPSTNTVTAVGTSTLPVSCGGGTVRVTASDICEVPSRPCIAVTKECVFNEETAQVDFHGTVTNCGNVTLNDISVVDDKAGDVSASLSATTLAPGASATYGGSYTPTEAGPTFVNTVTARGYDDSIGTCIENPSPASCKLNPEDIREVCDTETCSVTRRFPCVTRTPGYWFTHWKSTDPRCATLEQAIIANGNQIDLGFMCLSGSTDRVLREALGFFWKKKTRTGDGQRTSQLCRARKQLAFHLIAAIANVRYLGTNPANCLDSSGEPFPADLLEQARNAAACGDIALIQQLTAKLDEFNNSGADNDFPEGLLPCRADPRGAKAAAVDSTTRAICDGTANCADGQACN